MKPLIRKDKNVKKNKCSMPSNSPKRKEPRVPIRPIDEVALHRERGRAHITLLQLINESFSEAMRDTIFDAAKSDAEKKAQFRQNGRSVGLALSDWHCRAVDLVTAGKQLKADPTGLHDELRKALAIFSNPWAS